MANEMLLKILDELGEEELERFKFFLKCERTKDSSTIPKRKLENTRTWDIVDLMIQAFPLPEAVEVTKRVLTKIPRNDLVKTLSDSSSGPKVDVSDVEETSESREASFSQTEDVMVPVPEPQPISYYQQRLQVHFQDKFMCAQEAWMKKKDEQHLADIYTELYITTGSDANTKKQHEVIQMEVKPTETEKPIKPSDMFKPPSDRYKPIRTVLTSGIAGIGKTFVVHKFVLDWTNKELNQDVHLIFPFTFRQLNSWKGKKLRLTELIHNCIRETKDIKEEALNHIFMTLQSSGNTNYDKSKFKLVFVLDGLDESRLQLNCSTDEIQDTDFDVTQSTSVDVLLSNLIKRNLLPSARLWITTRPAAANQIHSDFVDVVTEVRGFTDPQKEEYFRKRFRDEEQASRIISHIKTSRSLHIMCHIPVFCWITATVLEDVLKTREGGELPKTLTQMYAEFLVFQIRQTKKKYGPEKFDQHMCMQYIESLAKLAFHQLEKGNLIFYETDLKESGIDVNGTSVFSGVFTEIFKEEHGRKNDEVKMFSFVHLSVQEFLAALYVEMSLINKNKNVMSELPQPLVERIRMFFSQTSVTNVHRFAIDKALQSPNGHLDLFLRFLLGLSLQTSQTLPQGLLEKKRSSETNQETVEYIKKKISENLSPEKSINLFHCLNELNDGSLVEEIQQYLRSESLSTDKLSPAQWSALVFILLSSEEDLDVFDLKKYSASEEVLLRLLPVVKASNKALLSGCNLSERSCEALSSVLSSQSSNLRELDLNNNDLKDSGVKLLAASLERPHCALETLRLSGCNLSERSCEALSSVLSSKFSSLRELDLSDNDLRDSGVKLLSVGMKSPHCKLKTLRLSGCLITEEGCTSLTSALRSNPSHLRKLDLSYNHPGDSGVKQLSAELEDPHWKLDTLRLSGCNLSERSCEALSSVLSSQSSSLRELDLRDNDLQDSGMKPLSLGLESPHCKLENLRLMGCNLSERSCEALSSVLSSQSSSLRELDLSSNDLQDSGVKLLCVELESRHCKLETLRLSGCLITEEGCTSLASALSSNPSHLRELDLSYNHPGDSGVKLLEEGPHWKLDTLRVEHGGEQRLKPGLRKYVCELTVDTNTVSRKIKLFDNNRKVTVVEEEQSYPDHPERFDSYCPQLLCRDGLTGRCYWEVEWRGMVHISVSYRGIRRRGNRDDCMFGQNNQSWSLFCSDLDGYSVWHNNRKTDIPSSSSSASSSPSYSSFVSFFSSDSNRVAVYVDCPAGTLSFYRVSDSLIHLHTFNTTFTQPLYPGFGFWFWQNSSVSLCSL
ncbi:NACHT, LRR and PYD domains-containing protein 3-like isoform X1 [Sparus aurata]|nr:NACHT, LRR and PYD domains-containing protein 3-like isoform X1 [Sparus aurata]XP_030259432.1 NACHT, LRR and PYD domains-containing protein 3-like isoform X1 [Sparus aurata]XP_030259512.1 NACHT, LRR and PYD domains-containing protein 3-like isoform X1 [Sparus aurata]XP_030259582.1 NACHT, LRR and PYD domains-containing protein 3-like isoform X1 [Sparus aurata]XP_030259661.1 NACHT, LRR and PYD domains-containing protein 3-like isoform X1 [Sparus aurata]XP_030259735.1 NACHT, LRR and PYD domain